MRILYVHTCIYVGICICMYMHTGIQAHVLHTCMQAHTQRHRLGCGSFFDVLCTYIHKYIHIYIHKYIHIHIHTYVYIHTGAAEDPRQHVCLGVLCAMCVWAHTYVYAHTCTHTSVTAVDRLRSPQMACMHTRIHVHAHARDARIQLQVYFILSVFFRCPVLRGYAYTHTIVQECIYIYITFVHAYRDLAEAKLEVAQTSQNSASLKQGSSEAGMLVSWVLRAFVCWDTASYGTIRCMHTLGLCWLACFCSQIACASFTCLFL
jgi:hypothetical protein